MLSWISQIGTRGKLADPPRASYPGIDAPTVIYAIGDVHGRSDLLTEVHRAIDRDWKRKPAERRLEVYLGDYIDRGADSAGVVSRLRLRAKERPVRPLKGNHEAMFLDFLDGRLGDRDWLEWGGAATALSYGMDPRRANDLRQMLPLVIPTADLAFLRSLQDSFRYGPYFFAHAGVRPERRLEDQAAEDLLWIRKPFLDHAGSFGAIVVHGHTPNQDVQFRSNRINLDTGAYATNRLTCLRIDAEGAALVEA